MLKINRACHSLVVVIVLLFSLFGTQGRATAKTTQGSSRAAGAASANGTIPLSGVPYNVGDVFAAVGNGMIKHFSSNGVLLDTLDTTTGSIENSGMAFDTAGNLYATNFTSSSASKFDNQGNLLGPFASGLSVSDPESVLVDAAGDIYIGYATGDLLDHTMLKFNANGMQLFAFQPARENRGADWIDLAADECTIFYTSEGSLIKRFNVCTNTQLSDFASLPISGVPPDNAAFALRIRSNGEVLVATGQAVFRLDAAGTVIETYAKPAGEASTLFALNLDPDLTSFWTAGNHSGNVYKIDIATGALLQSFNAGILGDSLGGLAIFGEITGAQQSDLSITKSDSPDPAVAGSDLTYTLTMTNNGPSDATGVTVTDTLPAGVTLVSATPSQGTCTVVTCDLGDLASGGSATITIIVTVDANTPSGTMVTNTASVTGNETDPDTSNNTASATTTVVTACTILDDFNRADGPLGSNWDGHTSGYRIRDNQAVVREGGPIYWQPDAYAADQEACVTLTRIDPDSRQHALLLKVQELNDWRQGAILVSYNARSGNVDVKARDVSTNQWVLAASLTPPTPVVNGDQLRARAFADGKVEVLINDTSIGTADPGSFYANKGGQIGLWFRNPDGDDDDRERDRDDDHDRLIQGHKNDDDKDDDDGPSSARRALLDDFGGGSIITTPTLTLTQISSDPFTNTTSRHQTQVEPDTYSNGSTIVAVMQSGRFFDGGASNICWSTLNNASLVANGCLPGITKFSSPAGIFDRVSDPAVAFDAKHGVWLVSTLAVTDTPSLLGAAVLTSISTDATATAWNNPVNVSVATGSSFYDKNWIACDNTPASPFYGNCYTQWDDNGQGNMLQMSTSSDGGLTWGPKKIVGTGASGLGGQPVVQPNGTVIVPYSNNGSQILAFLSTDGGTSWGNPFLVSNVSFHIPGGNLRSLPLPSAEIDGAGRVYVVWADCRFRSGCTSNDLVMSTSTDGMSWTSVIRVPIGSDTDGVDHFIPGIAVDVTTSGATAKVGITYYYYPVANCSSATCQLDVGFISSPDGGASWTSAKQLAGPMTLSWLPDTSQGRMVGDYISTSYGSDGLAHGVFIVAHEPTGNPDCEIATPNCDQATYTTSTGLALSTMSNTPEALIAAEVGVAQPPIPLNTDEHVPDQSNLTAY